MSVKFTMVMDPETAQKMSYIGAFYGRSRIKEIEWACKQYIAEFEKAKGKIDLSKEENDDAAL